MKIYLVLLLSYIVQVLTQTKTEYAASNLNHWNCNIGKKQSPIELKNDNSTYSNEFGIVYDNYKSFENIMMVLNQDNLLEVNDKVSILTNTNDKGYIAFDYKGFLFKYNLEKIVIHTPAEHYLENFTPDIEVQFYHRKDIDFTSPINEFQKVPDINKYLVISMLYSVNGTYSDNNFIDNLRNYYYANRVNTNSFGMNLDIISSGLIRDKRFYFYKGSDTIAPCNEDHLRYVIADVYTVKQSTVDYIRNIYDNRFVTPNTSKPLALHQGRPVYRNFYRNEEEYSSATNTKVFYSLLLVLFALIL